MRRKRCWRCSTTAAAAVSAFEIAPEEWRLEAYPQSPLLTPDLSARLALAAAAAGGEAD